MTLALDDPRLGFSSFAAISERSATCFRPLRPSGAQGLGFVTPCGRLAFETDASSLAFDLQSSSGIDGVPIYDNGLDYHADLLIDGHLAGTKAIIADGGVKTLAIAGLGSGFKRVELIWPTSRQMDLVGLRADYRHLSNARVPERRIVCGGDSITQGLSIAHPTASWAFKVARGLDVELINMGYAGHTAMQGDGAQDGALGGAIGTYLVGYNDWITNNPLDRFRGAIERYVADWFAASRIADAKLVMISPLFSINEAHTNADGNRIQDFREAMRTCCLAFDAIHPGRVVHVDGLSIMTHAADRVPDGVHPGDLGAADIALGLEPILRRLI